MRSLAFLGGAFALGWVLSWMYYDKSADEAFADSAGSLAMPQQLPVDLPSASDPDIVQQPVEGNQPDQAVSLLDVTLDRLQRGDFETLMAEYLDTQGQLSAGDANRHKGIIVDHARLLLQSGRSVDAQVLLGLYLNYEYRDVEALLLMAEIYQAAGNDLEAIEILFQARSYAYTAALIEQADNAIRSAVRNYDAQLLARKDHIARLDLYRRLTELEPEYTLHFIALAETYLALGNAVDARNALALTQHDSSVSAQVSDITRRINDSLATDRQYASAVSLQPFGNQFLVDAVLNNKRNAVLLLDTGASLSIISAEFMQALRVPKRATGRMAWFSTAGGRVQAPIVKLDSLALDGIFVENIEVGVIAELDGAPFDGLLGMNFLRHFEFFIDQNQGELQLTPH